MPYIKQEDRYHIDTWLDSMPEKLSSGELNYILTSILLDQKPKFYDDYNTLMGVLESCKLEFYRRAVVKFEDGKCELNGDVY